MTRPANTRTVVSPRARADLDEIWDYTETNWGIDQAESYVRDIAAAFDIIAADPRRGQDCNHVRAGYRKYAVGAHVVFYRVVADEVDIVRILHGRMDFERHL